jgi:hypothetical protein
MSDEKLTTLTGDVIAALKAQVQHLIGQGLIAPDKLRDTIEARREKARALVDAGLSQRQAAAELGVAETTVRRDLRHNVAESAPESRTDERDERRLKNEALAAIEAEALGVDETTIRRDLRQSAAENAAESRTDERRAGELDSEREKQHGSRGNPGGRGAPFVGSHGETPQTLSDLGVTKQQMHRWRNLAALDDADFEWRVEKAKRDARVTASERAEEKKERRAEREAELGAKQNSFPRKQYGVIYADPPWAFKVYSEDTGQGRAAEAHYPTHRRDATSNSGKEKFGIWKILRRGGEGRARREALIFWPPSPK